MFDPSLYTKSLWEIEKGFNLYTVYYQHRHKNFTKKLYSHSAAETESVESKHELRKYFAEKKSRSLWQSLFTFTLFFFYKNIVFQGQAEYSYFSPDFRL